MSAAWATLRRAPERALVAFVRGYQLVVSPWFPPSCKYEPSCSHYAIDALRHHGAVKGVAVACWRLLRCNPWSDGGYDPVVRDNEPPTVANSGSSSH
ncbi:membrane protein insertion efficiency factor YidD [Micrococcales bacterium 31B]|nr:membrane protein insertion efficiency factor YidD [Micrococcales bacterium 31B]